MSPDDAPQQLEYLLQATRELRDALDLESYLQLLVDSASALTGSESVSLLFINEQSTQFHFIAGPALQRDVLKVLDVPVEGSVAGRVFASGVPEIISGLKGGEDHFTQVDDLTGIDTRTMAVVPLIFKGQKLGVLEAVNRQGNADYTEEDIVILEIIAAQAALLLYNDFLEKRFAKATEETALLDRMKNNFIAIASHELRTPLGLILGHSTFLRELVEPDYHEQLDTVIRAATKLKEIIESLSSVDNFQSGMSSLRSRMVSIKKLVQMVADEYQDDAKAKKITLSVDVGQSELWVDGDYEKLLIALSNLVKNAITFTDDGGMVSVSAEQVPGYVKLTVLDNGIGVPAADLNRIFERFYQVQSHLTRTHGGMGLGLSVAKAMIELHGGRIWGESVEGKGSSFTILLPLDPEQVDAAKKVFTS